MVLFVYAWILIIIGIIAAGGLVIYTEYGRDVSVPFSVTMLIIASISIGFSIHFFLISSGM
jgi:hypothetical protein